jgi:hypothetical protein
MLRIAGPAILLSVYSRLSSMKRQSAAYRLVLCGEHDGDQCPFGRAIMKISAERETELH